MKVYTLPDPNVLERKLVRRLAGSSRTLAKWGAFTGGEEFVRVSDIGTRVCVLGRTLPPAENVFRTLMLIDTLRRGGAKDITLVIPYFAYSRQDRAVKRGDSVAALWITQTFASAGADRIVTADVHSERIADSSPIPVISVSTIPLFVSALKSIAGDQDVTIVSPDNGGRARADILAGELGLGKAVCLEKKRTRKGGVQMLGIKGRLRGKSAVLVDDMVSTGGTVREAVKVLREAGVSEFRLCATHPAFAGDACRTLKDLGFSELLFTDTREIFGCASRIPGIRVLGVADALVDAIK